MPDYLTPGVYVEEVSYQAPTIEGVGTSTAGFAGVALTGPVTGTPELLTSFGDFQNIYGGYDNLALTNNPSDPKNTNYLALGVKGFFDNDIELRAAIVEEPFQLPGVGGERVLRQWRLSTLCLTGIRAQERQRYGCCQQRSAYRLQRDRVRALSRRKRQSNSHGEAESVADAERRQPATWIIAGFRREHFVAGESCRRDRQANHARCATAVGVARFRAGRFRDHDCHRRRLDGNDTDGNARSSARQSCGGDSSARAGGSFVGGAQHDQS